MLSARRRRARAHRVGTPIASGRTGASRGCHRIGCRPARLDDGTLGKGAGMLPYAVVFFVIALIAALFGFGGIAAGAVEIAKVLFFIFLALFVVSLILGLFRRGT